MGSGPRLNLGCGGKILPGYINVDLAGNWSGKQPDVVSDLRSLPFPDGHADEAQAIHVIEHFNRWEVPDVLKEWHRVLKPGGVLALEAPCFEKVIAYMMACVQTDQPMHPRLGLWAMYGDPNYRNEAMNHRWLWSVGELSHEMQQAGFVNVTSEKPLTHIPSRDMRLVARKP